MIKSRISNTVYIYRYDLISLSIVFSVILWFLSPILGDGHIVFSDLDFPLESKRYLEEILGLWNDRWNTPTMLNLPRVFAILPSWLFSRLFDNSGSVLIKSFITGNILTASFTIYIFIKSLIRVYLGDRNTLLRLLAISIGSIFYAINPWVIYRIQHIYLLCGYSLLPLALVLFFKVFDPKFQEIIIPGYSVFRIKLYKTNILHIGLLGITISIMSAAIHYFFYTIILIILLWILLLLKQLWLHKYGGNFLKRGIIFNYLSKAFLLGGITLIFCYYWFSIYFGSILIDAQSSQHNINVIDTLSLFSRYSTIDKSLLLISYWWPMFDLKELPVTFYIGGYSILVTIVIGLYAYLKRNHIILFLFILSVLFLIISTGTTLPGISSLFITLVMDVPFFGNLFRDPNKLLGIVAICYSVFLVFGVEKLFNLSIKGENRSYIIKLLMFFVLLISFILYVSPYRGRFISGFYKPVTVPIDYKEVQDKFIFGEHRVLNMPLSESMLQTSTGVTTLDWNSNPDNLGYNKATADFPIYQTQKNTIFHHEGSNPAIGYYINFLQYLIDYGLTEKLGHFMQPLGIDELSYGTGYLGHKDRQAFNQDMLKKQSDLSLHFKNNYFSLYRIENAVEPEGFINRLIYTSKGLQIMSGLSYIHGFSFNDIGIIYNSQSKGNPLVNIREGDFIETTTLDELILSSLPEEYYISPAKYVKNGNPFLGWSQSAIHTSDWMWHLRSQNIKPLRFDMSFLSGIALSFSSIKLDVPIYLKNKVQGKEYINFEDFILDGYSFTANDNSLVEVETYPLSIERELPLIHGIISKGQNYNIWQVGKSGIMPAEPETPYQFFLTISGKGSNKMHLKARFYDTNNNEIATAYILTPEENINFEYYKFFGEYITPKNTAFVRIDILTYQRPEQKIHWWIHDFSIKELSNFSAPNTIDINYKVESREPVIPFVRLFFSSQGGGVKIKVNDRVEEIITEKSEFSGFLWQRLKKYTPNEEYIKFSIENLGGFNAINEFVLLTESEYKEEKFKVKQALNKADHFILLEGEYDFDYKGSIQTKRNYTALSMGKGRSSYNGELLTTIELPFDGEYYISLSAGGRANKTGLNFSLIPKTGKTSYKKELKIIPNKNNHKSIIIDEKESIDDSYLKSIQNEAPDINNFNNISFKTYPLEKGLYNLSINTVYKDKPLIDINSMKYFEPDTILVPDFIEESELDGYSECISLTRDMISHLVIDDTLIIEYDKSCSADWYISSSPFVSVKEGQEYIINYDMRSENLFKRHSKILYLNNKDQVIKTDYIPEVEESSKKSWNNYQFITEVPENSVKMTFQVWGRANKTITSYTYLKDLRLYLYTDLPILDKAYIGRKPMEELLVNGYTSGSLSLKSEKSPHPIWVLKSGGEIVKSSGNINSLRNLFFINNEEYEMVPQLEKHYFIGFLLWPLGFLLIFILYINAKSKKPLKQRLKGALKKLVKQ